MTYILVVDSSESTGTHLVQLLEQLLKEQLLNKIESDCKVLSAYSIEQAQQLASEYNIDIAFTETVMPEGSGIQFAKWLKDKEPAVNIIFVTDSPDYAVEAFAMRVSGYLLKPVTKQALSEELHNLRYPVEKEQFKKVRIHTFGNFEVFADEEIINFHRKKAKELFAYLVDRRGASITTAEVAAILWENREYSRSLQKQTQNIISCMMKSLKENHIEDVIVRRWNHLAIDTKKVQCDYYELLDGQRSIAKSYTGEYMSNYSWAENTASVLFDRGYPQ